ncbi:lipase family protein [Vibrio europaeus]|uniref:Lipase n=1 Tax=Vibrio europaeus TaxID=300876 RepID=A0A178JG39_9VIBR|nr:lipase [Vibrio europaeus]MDC5704576.1 lipase [Vibrio europaeus]MDC5712072.1 lipase [Vibrio europaeus]MDC5717800.1 lipase [Vibrio europaeus]MDC5727699.1 lipase [Vibrio europaeus]MDC5731908.1 lipase [Vibrio europaeus]
MDSFNSCVQCNPDKNWLELEFMSENDEPIDGLVVTITLNDFSDTRTQTTSAGKVHFTNIPAGEWRASVTQTSLLTEVEKYDSRDKEIESPVKERVDKENADPTSTEQPPKQYKNTTIGDFWDEAPEDEFLTGYHTALDINASEEKAGFRLSHNQSYVFEVKALRSYIPVILDTDEFNLVNSYTFALLAQLAYASDKFGIPDGGSPSLEQGGIDFIVGQMKQGNRPEYCASSKENWLLQQVPYSQHLKYEFYADKKIGCEGYLLSNNKTVIVGVRGTQTYFGNEEIVKLADKNYTKPVKTVYPVAFRIIESVDGARAFFQSPGYQDVISDLDASQVAIPELSNTYVHQGFYQYAIALIRKMEKDLDSHKNKKFYICGHSLGGAGALIITAMLQQTYNPSCLRLFTYGMPRTGTHSFVSKFNNVIHYRHVNNHDLVPQVPFKWTNTSADKESNDSLPTKLMKGVTPLLNVAAALFDRVTDDDEDNYHHHGNLIQLLTYSVEKHQPNDVKQVLLTPRQTHITSMTFANDKQDDSFILADSLSKEHIDINGYAGTVIDSGLDHMMSEYIPNLKSQLKILLSDTLSTTYNEASDELESTENRLTKAYHQLSHELAESLGIPYHVGEAKRVSLKFEQGITKKIILNLQRTKQELNKLKNDPSILPSESIIYGDQKARDFAIEEQLQ